MVAQVFIMYSAPTLPAAYQAERVFLNIAEITTRSARGNDDCLFDCLYGLGPNAVKDEVFTNRSRPVSVISLGLP